PAVECEPCKAAAKRFLAKMQARKAAPEPVTEPPVPDELVLQPEPVTEPE
ncbi:unnamed protein product, partial [marine sediment metagenome]